MKKIVPKLIVISSQIFVGALFLILTLNTKSEISLKINSEKIDNLSQFVYVEEKKDEVIEENIDTGDMNQDEAMLIDSDNYFMDREVLNSYTGILTGYGPDCVGCGNYVTNKVSTASGYHIADIVDGVVQPAFTISYNDSEFGEVRVVAGDSSLPFNTIVRITIPGQSPFIAIVLDRGSTVGFDNCRSSSGCLTNFDLLFSSESDAIGKTHNVLFEILRIGL